MKNQGLLLTTPSKCKCVVTQFAKAMENHPGCCTLSAKLRGIVLPGKMPGRLPGKLAHSFWKCSKSIKKNSILGHGNTSD